MPETAAVATTDVRIGNNFVVCDDGLTIERAPTFDEWAALGPLLSTWHRGLAFVIGDWLNYGEERFSELAAQAIDHEAWAIETVKVYRWVAKQVARERRIPTLSFKHHQLVAGLAPARQSNWLAKASEFNWTTQELQKHLKDTGEPGAVSLWLLVRCGDGKDLDDLRTSLEAKGRVCKTHEVREKVAGTPKRRLTVKGKGARKK